MRLQNKLEIIELGKNELGLHLKAYVVNASYQMVMNVERTEGITKPANKLKIQLKLL